ncbi:esterase-like activity of phytase family protein [Alterinioella nitratireducens]|uniref:esterase-like activity of phytase family protein n=1 Tax=Alterinioella nitratireducens TaxID=2735915 RepID=UPI0015535814|nr:esterase-like activity of phytase family protein [Alterinioella nitratireducens]NPD18765.1 esterase-like activity of phytase family protein [Alterinioella nitratireducens]
MHRRSGRRLSAALVALTCLGAPAWAQEARLIGALTLRVDHPQWGGLSGVEMAGDGGSLVAVSDRGILFRATVTRDESGQITGLTLLTTDELTGRDGQRGPWAARDSEGLAMRADGTLFISFEGDHRVARYIGGGASEPLPPHPDFAGLQENASLEALAVDAEGTLYALPERSGETTRPFPVFRYRNGAWDRDLSLPREGDFLAVGADFDDRGRFYLLERDFSLFFGFATRIRRFEITESGLGRGEVLLQTRAGQHSNLEGLSLWRDAAGRLVASMVSDDNFSPLLPTQVVEYYLAE